jgi:hypothetical protein
VEYGNLRVFFGIELNPVDPLLGRCGIW